MSLVSGRGESAAVFQGGPRLYQFTQGTHSRPTRVGPDSTGAQGPGGEFFQPCQLQQKGLHTFLHQHPEDAPF